MGRRSCEDGVGREAYVLEYVRVVQSVHELHFSQHVWSIVDVFVHFQDEHLSCYFVCYLKYIKTFFSVIHVAQNTAFTQLFRPIKLFMGGIST